MVITSKNTPTYEATTVPEIDEYRRERDLRPVFVGEISIVESWPMAKGVG